MNLRAFRKLKDSGASLALIARETGCDYRTVKKYLDHDASGLPPKRASVVHPPKVIEPYAELIDEWLRKEPRLRGTVIHQRLVADYGFTHSYQRVKMYLAEASADLPGGARAAPTLRGAARCPGPGRLGRRGRSDDRARPREGLQLPHDAVLLA